TYCEQVRRPEIALEHLRIVAALALVVELLGKGVVRDVRDPRGVGRPGVAGDRFPAVGHLQRLAAVRRHDPDLRDGTFVFCPGVARSVAGGEKTDPAPVGRPARRRLAVLAEGELTHARAVGGYAPDMRSRFLPLALPSRSVLPLSNRVDNRLAIGRELRRCDLPDAEQIR